MYGITSQTQNALMIATYPSHRISAILGCIFAALLFVQPVYAQDKPVTLMDVFTNRDWYSMGVPNMQWMDEGDGYTFTRRDTATDATNIWLTDVKTDSETMLVNTAGISMPDGSDFEFTSYEWSADQSRILFTLNVNRVWRHSTLGTYAVYDRPSQTLIPLPSGDNGLRNVKFSPDGKVVGYVKDDNIWVFDLESKREKQLTFTTDEHVFNGRFGWVYEEEFSIVDGWRWSPDGASIAYWQEDENRVPEFTLTNWMPLHQELISIRYPKAGDQNPVMKIGVVNVSTAETVWMDIGTETDIYIPRIYWTNNPAKLCIVRMNRLQNHLELLLADSKSGSSKVIYDEQSTTGWIEIEDDMIRFLKHSDAFIFPSEKSGFKHLYLYDYEGNEIRALTSGDWEVTSVEGLTLDEDDLFYMSTETSIHERQLFAVEVGTGARRRVTKERGYHSINMNPAATVYLDSWSNLDTPAKIQFFSTEGDELKLISETKPDAFTDYKWQERKIESFVNDDGVEIFYSIILPADFDPAKKYPVYVDIYGGPGYQAVYDRWPSAVHQWVANEGFIVVQIDNRGSGGRGTAFKHAIYKQLGKLEAADYVATAKHLASLPYVDAERFGIWGWSYGGYMSALTLMLGGGTYASAVSIAPVTDWRLYDTIYAERFMQRPQDNPDGYDVGSCLVHADKLEGELLLIHGGNDDNVHVQNAMQLVDRLVSEGKDFDMRVYPNGTHGVVTSMKQRIGLYQYFMDHFKSTLQ
ncbi:MAG: S9 family peptidase [Ectothiorhodospiraceae bacterium]|nr:S9 family peptidase [Ectothiorhodospiraceae bacterium]